MQSSQHHHPIIDRIFEIFSERGSEIYAGEKVTQAQHALQTAYFADEESASKILITASLLHDLGHLLKGSELPKKLGENLDDQHEKIGYAWLKAYFGREVADPVRLHVPAKRYLCTTDSEYIKILSPVSYKSFLDQGGEMSAQEIADFEDEPYFKEAIKLRKWDDRAKDPTLKTPTLEHYLPTIEACIKSHL